jgi:predicted transposase YdaD
LPTLFPEIAKKLKADALEDAKEILSIMGILMGLKFSATKRKRLLSKVYAMEDSVIYQETKTEGKTEGKAEEKLRSSRSSVLKLANKQFSPASDWQKSD